MPEAYGDYAFYAGVCGGKLNEGDYGIYAPRAAAEINLRSHGRVAGAFSGDATLAEAVRRCESELVDILYGYARLPTGVASQDNDGLRVTFSPERGENEAAACARVCRRYLPREMLYAG